MIIYFIESRESRNPKHNPIKIGITNDLEKRIGMLQSGNPYYLNTLFYIKVGSRKEALKKEKLFHKIFAYKQLKGEWFGGSIRTKKSFTDLIKRGTIVDHSLYKIKAKTHARAVVDVKST